MTFLIQAVFHQALIGSLNWITWNNGNASRYLCTEWFSCPTSKSWFELWVFLADIQFAISFTPNVLDFCRLLDLYFPSVTVWPVNGWAKRSRLICDSTHGQYLTVPGSRSSRFYHFANHESRESQKQCWKKISALNRTMKWTNHLWKSDSVQPKDFVIETFPKDTVRLRCCGLTSSEMSHLHRGEDKATGSPPGTQHQCQKDLLCERHRLLSLCTFTIICQNDWYYVTIPTHLLDVCFLDATCLPACVCFPLSREHTQRPLCPFALSVALDLFSCKLPSACANIHAPSRSSPWSPPGWVGRKRSAWWHDQVLGRRILPASPHRCLLQPVCDVMRRRRTRRKACGDNAPALCVWSWLWWSGYQKVAANRAADANGTWGRKLLLHFALWDERSGKDGLWRLETRKYHH